MNGTTFTPCGFPICTLTGRLSLLLPPAIPWTITCFPLINRRYSKAYAVDGAAEFEGVPSAFSVGAETAAQEPRSVCHEYYHVERHS